MHVPYRVNVNAKRVGGGFGGKITRAAQTAAACALGAQVTERYVIELVSCERLFKYCDCMV